MSTIVNVHEAKTHLSRLLDRAKDGEVIILAKAGTPYAKLGPVKDVGDRTPGIAKGRLTEAFFEPLPDDELAAWGQ